jgi:hypothetical protein
MSVARRAAVALTLVTLAACNRGGAPPPRTAWLMPGEEWPAVATTTSAPVATSPISLTASDGTGLTLSSLKARGVVDEPLGFTELTMTFDNPAERVLEGTFRITLPEGASVSRFAMKIGDEWQEGEVVELQAARRAYEDFLHRKQDPALLEQAAGNEFSARVFPIPARGKKEIVIAYVQDVRDGKYVLPLRGLPQLGALEVSVAAAGGAPRTLRENDRTPSQDFVFDTGRKGDSSLRAGPFVAAVAHVELPSAADPVQSAVVLVDTSASRALGFDAQLTLVRDLLQRLGRRHVPVTVACFDQAVEPVFAGDAADFREPAIARIRARGALGASDLSGALRYAGGEAAKTRATRVVVITDGVATAGAAETAKLKEAALALRASGVERVDAVAVGGIRDALALTQIARAGLAKDGVVASGSDDPDAVARKLDRATRSGLEVAVEGATFWHPKKLDGAQAGDAVAIYAELPEGRPFKVRIGASSPVSLDPRPADRPLVERAVVQARVASLLERQASEPKNKAALDREIVALSVKHRVLGPLTGMLVLETEQDYARFGIDRKALADILTLQSGHVVRTQRAFRPLPNGPWRGNEEGLAVDAAKKADDGARAAAPSAQAPSPATGRPAGPPHGSPTPAPTAAYPQQAAPGAFAQPAGPRAAGGAAPPAKTPEPVADAKPAPITAAPPAPPPPPRAAMAPPAEAPARESESRRARSAPRDEEREADRDGDGIPDSSDGEPEQRVHPYTGRFATVMSMLGRGDAKGALARARAWRAEDPADVLALLALGEAAEKNRLFDEAARAYGSIIDLFQNRADLRRLAGERLERIGAAGAPDLAIDTFEKAAQSRPDHPSSHRLLAFALLKRGAYAKAFEAARRGAAQEYPSDRFRGVDRILREDMGLIAAAWIKSEPGRASEIRAKVHTAGGVIEDGPSLRFVLNWETDANDVDFHIHDGRGGHAYYSSPVLRSGGELYADVTTGYGPECFTIRGKKRAAPYTLEAHYYSRGPMGYGMGKLQVIEHDGNGNLRFDERPFVVMVDQAFVDLGVVE